MKQRGQKSAASAVVITGAFGKRPNAPSELTPRQTEIWNETVASEALDMFGTAALRNLLMDYCRHRASGEDISGVIDTFQPEWLKNQDGARRYHSLLKMRELETRAAMSAATKLRLTNQSRYTPQAASTASRNAAKGFKPWDM